MKILVRRAFADTDILAALDYYIVNAPEYALAFINDIELAFQHIQQFPASGSPRYAHELNLPELRVWRCDKYPYSIFYVEYDKQIEVWRVLHNRNDMPVSLQQEA